MYNNKLLVCLGTRPEWLKIKPILDHLPDDSYLLYFTGQHPDLLDEVGFDWAAKIPETKDNRLDSIIAQSMIQFPNREDIGAVLVQGDTASAFGCALAAFNRNLFIFYLESGLRTNDKQSPYPEEAYRQMISRIADVNFCPTELSSQNLNLENISFKGRYIVGNTILDGLLKYKSIASYEENTVIITLHRRENASIIKKWFSAIDTLAQNNQDLRFIFIVHPTPYIKKNAYSMHHVSKIEPQTHEEFLKLLCKCKFVITDSGGLQEEAAFLNKKVIVCRKNTERPEGISSGHLKLCKSPEYLEDIFYEIKDNFYINNKCPYGDGKSSIQISKIIKSYLNL